MKVTEEGTTNIIKWYQPESIEECNTTDCAKCIFHRYVDEGVSCQFRLYLTHPPVRKPTDTDEQLKTIQNKMRCGLILGTPNEYKKAVRQMTESCKIIDYCEQLQNEKLEQQIEPLQNMINVLDLIVEIEDKQAELTKMRQGRVITPAQPTIHLKDEMVCTAEKQTESGEVGDLNTLSFVRVGRNKLTSREYYHHCPVERNRLVRLDYLPYHNEYLCPVCKQTFNPK